MVDTVHVPYRRRLAHPVEEAFAWLTDYRDDDPDRAGAIIEERHVVERTDERVVLEGELETLGRRMEGRAEVVLDPPDRWVATLYDRKERWSGTYTYELHEVDDPDACELVVDYEFVAPKLKHKLKLWLGRPLVQRRLDRMWDGFVEAMDAELAGAGAQAPDAGA